MCGIAGFWAREAVSDSRGLLAAMLSTIAHRGPDAEGQWHAEGVALGHRRLSIVDLSPAGAQPMRSHSGRSVIVFNGEVYNHHSIRQQLIAEGVTVAWKGHSDTETMLEAIEHWGLLPALERFRGMFAFAWWEVNERRLWMVRDRLGVKPLAVTQTRAGIAFASELRALRPFPGFSTELDLGAVSELFRANCIVGRQSIYRGTWKLEPGTLARFDSPTAPPVIQRWWDSHQRAEAARARPFTGSTQDAIDELERRLTEAVKLRMEADVPLGALLSGGVDSSTVVALMQSQSSQPVHTFSIENESEAFDEGPAARAVAAHLGTHHVPFKVSGRDALEVVPRLGQLFDEPFADASQIPTYLVSKLARQHVTVALSGDGGDEVFGGYTRHIWGPRVARAQSMVPAPLRGLAASAIESLTPDRWDRLFASARALGAPRLAGLRMYKLAAGLRSHSVAELHRVLSSQWRPGELMATDAPPPPFQSRGPVAEAFMAEDLTHYLPDDVLTKVDRASMAVALEAREPLLDHQVLELAWSLPTELKVRGRTGKWILRQVLRRHVPEGVGTKGKMGFAVPLNAWLRGPLREWAEALLTPSALAQHPYLDAALIRQRWSELQAGTRPWENHLWTVLMFQAWSRGQQ